MNERILAYFDHHPDRHVSGEQLSRELGCSRTAVWKHIQHLKQLGYIFEAVPKLGYKLRHKPVVYNMAKLISSLKTERMGRELRVFDEVDSTQNIAQDFVKQGAAEGTLVLAEQQTAGRGRMGRSWFSPKGVGIWMSLILRPNISVQFTPQLTLLAAVALCRTLQEFVPHQVGIKWPNDLLIRGRKVSGILLESSAEDERLNYVIAGVGVSVNLREEDYTDELRVKATSLFIECGKVVEREAVICKFLKQFEHLYDMYIEAGFAPIRTMWEALTVSLHKPIRIQTAQGWVDGVANAIDELGALIVTRDDGQIFKLYSGDIEL